MPSRPRPTRRFRPALGRLGPIDPPSGLAAMHEPLPDPEPSPGEDPGLDPPVTPPPIPPAGPIGPGTT